MTPQSSPAVGLTALVGATLLALGASVGVALAEELRPDQVYPGGTQVESSELGVSFTIPAGWIGRYGQSAKGEGVLLGSNTVEGIGLAVLKTGQTVDGVAAQLAETQDLGDGIHLVPTGAPKVQGSLVAARYMGEPYVGLALALVGPERASVVFFFAGPSQNEAVYFRLLSAIGKSTSFAQPRPAPPEPSGPAPPEPSGPAPRAPVAGDLGEAWTRLLSGSMLHYFSRYNSGGMSGGMASHRVLHLCADGRFTYAGDSLATINVPGASASSGGRRGSAGRWSVEPVSETTAALILTQDGGQPLRWKIEYDGQKTFVNGQRWLRATSDACR
jgi:hypothetical protein